MKTQNHEYPTKQTFTLGRQVTSSGDVVPDVEEVVLHAKHCAARRDGGKLYLPRFTIKIDGERIECGVERLLRRHLSCFAVGSKCDVYRNGGNACTIDFDRH